MLDFFQNTTGAPNQIESMFETATATAGTSWQTWVKPRGAKLVNILAQGGGGAGGQGTSYLATGVRSGGGGGSAGGRAFVSVPAFACPDVLYISVGAGGAGTTGAGAAGIGTYVSLAPTTALNTSLFLVTCPGGGGGIVSTGGTGTQPTVNFMATLFWMAYGSTDSMDYSGTGGGRGAGAANTNLSILELNIAWGSGGVSGGAGGGGLSANVVNNTGAVYFGWYNSGSLGLNPSDSQQGSGIRLQSSFPSESGRPMLSNNPLFGSGGVGGTSATSSVQGGNGGNGFRGGGGGGSGVYLTTATLTGGNGGNGFVYINVFL